ncbi:MAG: hypothetical protein AAGH99_15180 [Planctomycetota bacterium]
MPPAPPDTFVKHIARRSLRDASLDGPPVQHFKQDDRSEVWSVDAPSYGQAVIKRFAAPMPRQRLALAVGRHPGQLELKQHRKLHAAGIPVATIFDAGITPGTHPGATPETHPGSKPGVWLATAWIGDSLQHHITAALDTPDPAEHLGPALDAAATLTRALLDAGFTFKDLKPSNLALDAQGRAHLLDAGSARATTNPVQVRRMLAVMQRVLRRDNCPELLITRFFEAVGQSP